MSFSHVIPKPLFGEESVVKIVFKSMSEIDFLVVKATPSE
jgi:hypothetical protein